MPDHVHMMISIPPKYAVSQVIGYVKGKSAIHLARVYGERRRQPSGPRSKSWLRNVVTSQPIRANSWSSQPVSRVAAANAVPML
jgi:REP element-mobilizing transposase RayT